MRGEREGLRVRGEREGELEKGSEWARGKGGMRKRKRELEKCRERNKVFYLHTMSFIQCKPQIVSIQGPVIFTFITIQ